MSSEYMHIHKRGRKAEGDVVKLLSKDPVQILYTAPFDISRGKWVPLSLPRLNVSPFYQTPICVLCLLTLVNDL